MRSAHLWLLIIDSFLSFCYPLETADINVSVYAKFLMNGYVDEANYLEYLSYIRSLSYVEGKQHLCSFDLSVGIGL